MLTKFDTNDTECPCRIADFVGGMIKSAKNSPYFLGAENPLTPVLDVTKTVQKVYLNVKKAKLTIYGNRTADIQIIGKFAERPKALTPGQIVANWLGGYEVERQKCEKDGYWYWIVYPAKLETDPPITGYSNPDPMVNYSEEKDSPALKNPLLLAGIGVAIGVAAIILITKLKKS